MVTRVIQSRGPLVSSCAGEPDEKTDFELEVEDGGHLLSDVANKVGERLDKRRARLVIS